MTMTTTAMVICTTVTYNILISNSLFCCAGCDFNEYGHVCDLTGPCAGGTGELVGAGSFGQVFGGILTQSGRRIAVKVPLLLLLLLTVVYGLGYMLSRVCAWCVHSVCWVVRYCYFFVYVIISMPTEKLHIFYFVFPV